MHALISTIMFPSTQPFSFFFLLLSIK